MAIDRGVRWCACWLLALAALSTSSCALLNRSPTAVIRVSPERGYAPLEVSLDGSGSYDPDGIVVGYEWTLGDGATSSDKEVTHIYAAEARYRVILRVTDDDGAIARSEVSIPVARFDLTGPWTGVIRDDVDEALRGPYALDLVLYQMGDGSITGQVKWASVIGFYVIVPITSGHVAGTSLELVASGLFTPDPDRFPYVVYSVRMSGKLEGDSLQGTGAWDDGTTFRWSVWE